MTTLPDIERLLAHNKKIATEHKEHKIGSEAKGWCNAIKYFQRNYNLEEKGSK
mgnify:CR=1 FL=1|tara:strand:+ start:608 stop:766 length:159 start_codon:yes stop_codon:yes gene_type:complete